MPRLLVALLALLTAGAPQAETRDFAVLRHSGEVLATLGNAQNDPDVLFAALSLLLRSGADIAPGDPWGADRVLDSLNGLVKEDMSRQRALDRLLADTRGVTGPNRLAFRLDPGQVETVQIGVLPEETAIVEVRLRRDSGTADLDLTVSDNTGTIIVQDAGPSTGRVGRGLFLEWQPEACRTVSVAIRNVGDVAAEGVFLAPPPLNRPC